MLQLKNIRKSYKTGELVQTALDDVSLNLRESELVAILGPSGSGKSTLLNVIGGLDQYDSGDLIIDGISTKAYHDRDWDSYRNHTVGFVFQSYNLIPHQSVLANVELALTISGIPKAQRRDRAIKALEQVGLGNQIHKKPNQMSGGQMQRVAIARALVNNPRIILADEPTGALDSETSVQVMDLLKEVAKDRLVVMVTHNPELAMQYADRIVRVKDGKITDDTNPYEVTQTVPAQHKNMGKASMSFFSALSLSFQNLKSKMGRTLLTAFAGSIGIIGIALIMSLSTGFQRYIDQVQEDTLANNPLVIQSETADVIQVLYPNLEGPGEDAQDRVVAEQPVLSNMFEHIGSNDLQSFKHHLEDHEAEIGHTLSAVEYDYGIQPLIYTADGSGYRQVNPTCMFKTLTGNDIISAILDVNTFQQMLDDRELLDSQYQMLEGRWPESYNELVFVLPSPDQISDHVAYNLGLKDMDSLEKMVNLLLDGNELTSKTATGQWSYSDLMNLSFQLVPQSELYRKNEEYGVWENMSADAAFVSEAASRGEELHVVGVVCPREGSSATTLAPGIAYPSSLTRHVIEQAASSDLVQMQLADPDTDVFSGKPFGYEGDDMLDFEDLITIDDQAISDSFGVNMKESDILNLMQQYLDKLEASLDIDTTPAMQDFLATFRSLGRDMLTAYADAHADETGMVQIRLEEIDPMVSAYLQTESADAKLQQLASGYSISTQALSQVYKPLLVAMVTDQVGQTAAEEMTLSEQEPADADPDAPAESKPEENVPAESVPEEPLPELPELPESLYASYTRDEIDSIANGFSENSVVQGAASVISRKMMEGAMMEIISSQIAGFGTELAQYIGNSFYVDESKLANAFQFEIDETEMHRLIEAMSGKAQERTAAVNLRNLGYADLDKPASISFYMADFDGKEEFMQFLDDYNQEAADTGHEEKMLQYSDMAGMMMSSVRTIINSVSYVLIALVAVSLLVSSIMIGIITYISVMERTKEIGLLRAMGASKHNISQVFNAETFIIGLFSGVLGIVAAMVLLIPGNRIIHVVLGNPEITAFLPLAHVLMLVILSVFLTLLGGLIPSAQASKKDPVTALRTD